MADAGMAIINELRLSRQEEATGISNVTRTESLLAHAVKEHQPEAEEAMLIIPEDEIPEEDAGSRLTALTNHRFNALKGAVFAGHKATDLDSIAGAIGGAHLYKGIASRASEINDETVWVLEHWGYPVPPPVEEVLAEHPDAPVCLVDFQQLTQLNSAIDPNRVVAVIDHHALQNNTIVVEKPIYMDIRPWGSMATIIAHNFLVMKKPLPANMAGLLLSAILSDTLNLRSPTSTDVDAMMVSILSMRAGVEDVNVLASQQFKAKSSKYSTMSDHAILVGDMKEFTTAGIKFAFGVVETNDAESLLARVDSLRKEMNYVKQENGFEMFFFAIIDVLALTSELIVVGPRERSLVAAAFPECPYISEDAQGPYLYNTAPFVSRKAQLLPPVCAAMAEGWVMPAEDVVELAETKLVMGEQTDGFLVRVPSRV